MAVNEGLAAALLGPNRCLTTMACGLSKFFCSLNLDSCGWVSTQSVSGWPCTMARLLARLLRSTTPFGDRHNYLCVPEGPVISPDATLSATKQMHVSPFQEVSGEYLFNFNILSEKLSIKINLSEEGAGFFANLTGHRQPLRSRTILGMLFKRPFGALRTIVLIYWQALKLKLQGETYRPRPAPPQEEIS